MSPCIAISFISGQIELIFIFCVFFLISDSTYHSHTFALLRRERARENDRKKITHINICSFSEERHRQAMNTNNKQIVNDVIFVYVVSLLFNNIQLHKRKLCIKFLFFDSLALGNFWLPILNRT